jgi:hypothetical protein
MVKFFKLNGSDLLNISISIIFFSVSFASLLVKIKQQDITRYATEHYSPETLITHT